MCSDPWDRGEPDGVCPDCGEETVEGEAATGCYYSPETCKTCGARPCDWSC